MGWNGHFWTIAPRMGSWLTRTRTPAGERPWHLDLDDPEAGRVRLPGRLADPGNGTLLILVHGLGGSIDSPYMLRFAHAAAGQGLATLRLGLRGSGRQGGDFYQAGLSGDLEAVVASPGLAGFEHLWIVGFSLGGHLTLRFGTHVDDPRVRAVVGICAPIDLDACVRDFDQPEYWLYRRYILHGLRTMVGAMGDDAPVDHPAALDAVKLLRDWGRALVSRAPRIITARPGWSIVSPPCAAPPSWWPRRGIRSSAWAPSAGRWRGPPTIFGSSSAAAVATSAFPPTSISGWVPDRVSKSRS